MPAFCKAYRTDEEARAAVERLFSAGIDGQDIRVFMGEPSRDALAGAAGEFAGTAEPEDAVGAFAGSTTRAKGMGGFAGDADRMRQGGFGDTDRETVTTFPGGVRRDRIAAHRDLEKLLRDAGLDEATAKADVERLHAGATLVLFVASEDVA